MVFARLVRSRDAAIFDIVVFLSLSRFPGPHGRAGTGGRDLTTDERSRTYFIYAFPAPSSRAKPEKAPRLLVQRLWRE